MTVNAATEALPLLPQHQQLITNSRIRPDVQGERGYFSARSVYDLKRFGFAETQCAVPALGIPIWGVDRGIALYQARADQPRLDPETGKPRKYETAAKARMALDVPPRAHPYLGDPTTPLWITEGVRKADSAVSNGIDCCIDVIGVWNWRGKNADGGLVALPDWESVALNGRLVFICYDSDVIAKPSVRKALARLKAFLERRGARVRIVQLPQGPGGTKQGLDDWFANGGTVEQLEALAIEALPEREQVGVPPFPMEVFPPAVRRYIADGAEALGVAPDMVAVPFLALAGGTIGNTRSLLVKPGWIQRPTIWTAVIANPGSGKSPALDIARAPLDALQLGAWEQYQAELAAWQRDAAVAKEQKAPEPPRPVLEHFYTSDATTEALGRMLSLSAGCTMIRDELVGWTKSHDAYRKAGDRETYLSLWAGVPTKIDRKTSETLLVARPALCVTGGIQPDRLGELRGDGEALDGFLDRFLFSYPETTPQLWTETEPDPRDLAAVRRLFGQLRAGGPEEGQLIRLAPEARQRFAVWFNENALQIATSRGLAAGFAAKFPGQLARLVLILHTLNRPDDLTGTVPAETVEDGIALVEYFAAHLARVLPAFGTSAPPREAGLKGRVVRILERADGAWVIRSAINEGLGGHTPTGTITAALAALAADGRAESRTLPTGGRPREEWRAVRKYGNTEKAADESADGPAAPLFPYFRNPAHGDGKREVWAL